MMQTLPPPVVAMAAETEPTRMKQLEATIATLQQQLRDNREGLSGIDGILLETLRVKISKHEHTAIPNGGCDQTSKVLYLCDNIDIPPNCWRQILLPHDHTHAISVFSPTSKLPPGLRAAPTVSSVRLAGTWGSITPHTPHHWSPPTSPSFDRLWGEDYPEPPLLLHCPDVEPGTGRSGQASHTRRIPTLRHQSRPAIQLQVDCSPPPTTLSPSPGPPTSEKPPTLGQSLPNITEARIVLGVCHLLK
ncbi:hypothetical protein E2C01_015128 [Portunus trituberculatus]|uniref:Uncharacterized protein n=1 Tax=Portunus trituberculatus TaxID=210409 RepID=A0A5B7DKH4_PORTR|nr:hypothetical protein [Portunus trituberculatus]